VPQDVYVCDPMLFYSLKNSANHTNDILYIRNMPNSIVLFFLRPQSAIPQIISAVNHEINKKLRFGYDVGKGFVMGEEEVTSFVDSMIDNTLICKEVKSRLTETRLEIIRELGEIWSSFFCFEVMWFEAHSHHQLTMGRVHI
jgi:sodium/hydrogen exchanger 10/11